MRRPWLRSGAECVGLSVALVFVFLMAYTPHLDVFREERQEDDSTLADLASYSYQRAAGERGGYPYPLHVDENLHWAMSANIQRSEQLFVDYPVGKIHSDDRIYSLRGAVHERGFQLILAQVQSITGVPYFHLFQFLPALWLTFTAFGVYAMLRPHAAAIPAAAFVGLIPTTVRFLGPSFLVPIGFVLAWIPAALILSPFAHRRVGTAFVLAALVTWAFFIHLIGGFAAVGLLAIAGFSSVREERRSALLLLLTAVLPVLWLYRAFASGVEGELQREEGLPIDFTIFDGFGVSALVAWVFSLPLFVYARPVRGRLPLNTFALGSVLVFAMIILSTAADLNRYATYARWHPIFFLLAAVPLGYLVAVAAGVVRVALLRIRSSNRLLAGARRTLPVASALLLAFAVVNGGVSGHLREQYYHVIDAGDWERFEWIAQNVGPEYEVFLVHPWKAPVLSAMSGKEPHTFLAPGAPPARGEDYDRFVETGQTAEFFILNDVTLVLSTRKPPHDFFVQLGPDVWGVKPEIAREIAAIRAEEGRASG